ncbi:hypothetical protein ACVDG8_020365 [Mesorhizobium sp. ORM8.1]
MLHERNSFTLISAHFGDLFWIEQMAAHVASMSRPGSIEAMRIVDQDRRPEVARRLAALPGHPEVLSFPEDGAQIALLGHDHPAALNRCMQLDYATTHVIVLDSDCFPITADWIDRIDTILADHDAIVARDSSKYGLSHPCFMVLPVPLLSKLNFSEAGADTGRLIGLQLGRLDCTLGWDTPTPAFRGRRGQYHLDGALYHHTKASFVTSNQRKLHSQVNARVERFFRNKVEREDFALSLAERFYLRLLKRLS